MKFKGEALIGLVSLQGEAPGSVWPFFPPPFSLCPSVLSQPPYEDSARREPSTGQSETFCQNLTTPVTALGLASRAMRKERSVLKLLSPWYVFCYQHSELPGDTDCCHKCCLALEPACPPWISLLIRSSEGNNWCCIQWCYLVQRSVLVCCFGFPVRTVSWLLWDSGLNFTVIHGVCVYYAQTGAHSEVYRLMTSNEMNVPM